jgi:mRNA interferase MazF
MQRGESDRLTSLNFVALNPATTIVVLISSNLRLATAPGNVLLSAAELITLDKTMLDEQVSHFSARTMMAVEEGV